MPRTKVRFSTLALALGVALALGCASAQADGLGVSLAAGVGPGAAVSPVTGKVSIFSFNPLTPFTPLPLDVTANPSGCHRIPLLGHVLFNTSSAPVLIYADPFCATIFGLPVAPGSGNHVPPNGSWAVLLPVALSLSLGPVSVGAAAVGGPGVDLTPVSIFTLDEGPLTSGLDLGACNLLPPLIAHAMANNSDRPVQVFVDPACTVPFITIPAGDGAHVIGDGSWRYADAPASAGVSTATKAAKPRRVAAVCARARAAHSTRAKVRRACAKVKRAARATRHA